MWVRVSPARTPARRAGLRGSTPVIAVMLIRGLLLSAPAGLGIARLCVVLFYNRRRGIARQKQKLIREIWECSSQDGILML